MFKRAGKHVAVGKLGRHVVIGQAGHGSAFDSLLLPNGERALLVDRDVYQRALHAADEKFQQAMDQMRANRGRSRRERAV